MDHIRVGLVCALLLLIQYGNGADISITSPNTSPTILIGDPITLTISYSSTPNIISWTMNGLIVALWIGGSPMFAPGYQNRVTLQEKILTISNSTMADSGAYKVDITDTNGDSGFLAFNVVVKETSLEIQSNDTGIYQTGENIILKVRYQGTPTGIFWYYNGSPLVFKIEASNYNYISERILGRSIFEENGSLQIYNTTKDDAGNYTINVIAGILSGSRSFLVQFYDTEGDAIISQSPPTVGEMNDLVNLSCIATGGGNVVSVTWKKDLQVLQNDTTYTLLDGNTILQILRPNRTVSGKYSCNISNVDIWRSASYQLRVYDPVEGVTVTQPTQIVSENTSLVNLSCSVSSGYIESVTWMKDGQSIINNDNYNLLDDNKTLQIIQPKRSFTGEYNCTISNAVYSASSSLQLFVYDPVRNVTVTKSPEIVSENSSAVNLTCDAFSGYIESVTWIKNGKSITNDLNYSLLNENRTLQITQPNRTFSGTYICNMSNTVYWDSGSIEFSVYYPLEDFNVIQSPQIVDETSTEVNLTCNATSGYIESVTWTKDGESVINDGNYILLADNRTLQIFTANRTVTGEYICYVSDGVYRSSSSHQLRVHGRITNVKVSQAPVIVTEDSAQVNLTCNASSGYVEDVTWMKDGKSLSGNPDYTLSDGNRFLQINRPNRTFSGIYICNISNAAHWVSLSLNIQVYFKIMNVKVAQSPEKVDRKTPSVKLTCSSSTNNEEWVKWSKDNKLLDIKDPYTLSQSDKVLEINKPNKSLNGIYTCEMSNSGYKESGFLNLTISYAPLGATSTFSMIITSLLGGILLAH